MHLVALAGETSSVGTAATVGTTSLTSASSDEKQVEDTSKKTDGYDLCVVFEALILSVRDYLVY